MLLSREQVMLLSKIFEENPSYQMLTVNYEDFNEIAKFYNRIMLVGKIDPVEELDITDYSVF